jgi:hypothetical protein
MNNYFLIGLLLGSITLDGLHGFTSYDYLTSFAFLEALMHSMVASHLAMDADERGLGTDPGNDQGGGVLWNPKS